MIKIKSFSKDEYLQLKDIAEIEGFQGGFKVSDMKALVPDGLPFNDKKIFTLTKDGEEVTYKRATIGEYFSVLADGIISTSVRLGEIYDGCLNRFRPPTQAEMNIMLATFGEDNLLTSSDSAYEVQYIELNKLTKDELLLQSDLTSRATKDTIIKSIIEG